MSNALAVLDDIHKKLAAITTIEQAKKYRDQIDAIQHYAKVSKQSLKDQNALARVRFQVERRMGELLLEVPKVQGKRGESDGLLSTIKRSGFTQWAAFRWMALARMPESRLLSAAADCDRDGEELTSALVYEVLVRRHGRRRSTEEEAAATADAISLDQVKRDLQDWEILDPGALRGLSDLEARTLVIELRKAYEYYCEDPARGKVSAWGDEIDAKDLRANAWPDPFSWNRGGRWYPKIMINRRGLRTMGRGIIDNLLAGVGGGHLQIRRRLDLAGPARPGAATAHHKSALAAAPPVGRVADTYLAESKRFLVAIERVQSQPERLRSIAPVVARRHEAIRTALAQLDHALADDPSS